MSTTRNIIEGIKNVTSDVSATLDTKANQSTTYTKTEVDSKPTGFKNYIINGGFDVWQRGTSLTLTSSHLYIADRVKTTARNGAGTSSRYTLNDELLPFVYALKTSITTAATTKPNVYGQALEDSRRFRGKTVTVSFYAKASKTITVTPTVDIVWANADNVVNGDNITLTTTWTRYTKTFNIPAPSGTYNETYDHTHFFISSPINDTYDFYITGVQLEEGSVATPFENRPYGLELSLCQRYYEVVETREIPEQGTYYAGYRYLNPVMFKVRKRDTPTVTLTQVGGWPNGVGGTYITSISVDNIQIIGTTGTALTNQLQNFVLLVSAEL